MNKSFENKDKIVEIIKSSYNKYETLNKLNWDTNTSGYRKLNRFITTHLVDISHFLSIAESIKKSHNDGKYNFQKIPLNLILVSASTYTSMAMLKSRLYREGLKCKKCELCGQGDLWNGKKMSLILDHINGIHTDNRLCNLQIVCPNCNATLTTHAGKNKKYKKETYKKEKFGYTLLTYQKKHLKSRIRSRPDYQELIIDILKNGYTSTGKKYGVSDNTIRKWEKCYKKYGI